MSHDTPVDHTVDQIRQLAALIAQHELTIARIRARHHPVAGRGCAQCGGDRSSTYPCPTLQIIDGTESAAETA